MTTIIVLFILYKIGTYASECGSREKSDNVEYHPGITWDEARIYISYIRQDIRYAVFLLNLIVVMLAVIADAIIFASHGK
jgi:hypothetical protein